MDTARDIAERVKALIHFAVAGTLAGLLSGLGGSRGEDSFAVASSSRPFSSFGGAFGGEEGREGCGEEGCAEDDGSHILTTVITYFMEFIFRGWEKLRKGSNSTLWRK